MYKFENNIIDNDIKVKGEITKSIIERKVKAHFAKSFC